jgi:Uma2 family endonuclease
MDLMALHTEVARRRFTVDEYDRMAEAGILTPEDRVELIEGEIVHMAAIGAHHAVCVSTLGELLITTLRGRAFVRLQNPVRLPDDSEPEPDVAVLRLPRERYRRGHPGPPDVLFVAEVVETSHRYDRLIKLPLYARAGIPEAWLVDLPGEAIEVYREPGPAGYARSERISRDGCVSPAAFPDVALAVVEALVLSSP